MAYTQMEEPKKQDTGEEKFRLRRVFGMDLNVTYERLRSLSWSSEAIDIFLNGLKRLAKSAGIRDERFLKMLYRTSKQ